MKLYRQQTEPPFECFVCHKLFDDRDDVFHCWMNRSFICPTCWDEYEDEIW